MKRLFCLAISLLVLLALLPLYTFAETSDAETSDDTASSVTDVSTPESETESDLESDPESEVESDLESSEPDADPDPFTVSEWAWDETSRTLSVTWSCGTETLVEAVLIGTVQYPVNNSNGQFTVTLSDLDFGQYAVSYLLLCNGVSQTVEDLDSTHAVTLSGERDTTIELLNNNQRATVRVVDSKSFPVAGMSVHLEAGSTVMTLTTDANGCATFPLLLSDVTYVYTEDLQTEFILYKANHYPNTPPTTSTNAGTTGTVNTTITSETIQNTTSSTATDSTTTSTSEVKPVVNSTHALPNSTTSASDSTQPSHATHAGAGTTGTQNNMIVINVLTDEGILESLQLEIEDMDNNAYLLTDPETYAALVNENPNTAIMLSILSSNRTYSEEQAKTWLDQELDEYKNDSIQSVTMDLGIICWDMQKQTGFMATNLPKSNYIIRIPRPQNMENCNHFYVVDMSGDQPGEYTEAIVEFEYIQFTLNNGVGPVAIVACETEMVAADIYIHPLVYVFFSLGVFLILLSFVMVYFFFFHKHVVKRLRARANEASYVSNVDSKINEIENTQNNNKPEGTVSLDDILRKRPFDNE